MRLLRFARNDWLDYAKLFVYVSHFGEEQRFLLSVEMTRRARNDKKENYDTASEAGIQRGQKQQGILPLSNVSSMGS